MTATMSNEANLNLNTNDKMFPRAKCRRMNVVLIEYLTKTSDRDKLRGFILSPIHDPLIHALKLKMFIFVSCFITLGRPKNKALNKINIDSSTIYNLFTFTLYMTGLLHEGIFHVRDLLQPAIFESLPWAYVMCNWAQILICQRH